MSNDTSGLDEIAAEIAKVSGAIRDLREGPLADRTIIVLLHDATGVPKRTIEKVLDSAEGLEDRFLRQAE